MALYRVVIQQRRNEIFLVRAASEDEAYVKAHNDMSLVPEVEILDEYTDEVSVVEDSYEGEDESKEEEDA